MADYQVQVTPPLSTRFGDADLLSCGFWCQGPALLQAANTVSGFDLAGMGHNSVAYIHHVAESLKLAFADRERFYGDPNFVDVPAEWLLSDAYAAERRGMIQADTAFPEMPPAGKPGLRPPAASSGQPMPDGPLRHLLRLRDRPLGQRDLGHAQRSVQRHRHHPRHGPRPVLPRIAKLGRPGASVLRCTGKRPRLTPNPAMLMQRGRRRHAVRQPRRRQPGAGDAPGAAEPDRVRHGTRRPRSNSRASSPTATRIRSRRIPTFPGGYASRGRIPAETGKALAELGHKGGDVAGLAMAGGRRLPGPVGPATRRAGGGRRPAPRRRLRPGLVGRPSGCAAGQARGRTCPCRVRFGSRVQRRRRHCWYAAPERNLMRPLRLLALACLLPVLCAADPTPAAPTATPAALPDRALVIATKEAPPFAMKGTDGEWQGISIDLWRRMAEQLHLRYRFVEMSTVQDLTDATANGTADAAVAAITVTAARARTSDFTQPLLRDWAGSRRDRGLGELAADVAHVFVVRLPAGGPCAAWHRAGRWCPGLAVRAAGENDHFAGHPMRGLTSGIWWSAVAMTQAGAAQGAPASLPGRLLAVVWMIGVNYHPRRLHGRHHFVDHDAPASGAGAQRGRSALASRGRGRWFFDNRLSRRPADHSPGIRRSTGRPAGAPDRAHRRLRL